MAVEAFELLQVEARGRAADMVEVEPFDGVVAGDDLLVAMAPAEPEQIVEQGLGEDAERVAIGVDSERAVPFGELGPVLAVDQRDMAVDGLGPAERADDGELAEGVVEMIVAADHVGHATVAIAAHAGEKVGGAPAGAQQHKIVELAILDDAPPLDPVLDRRLALFRRLQADDERFVAALVAAPPRA